MATIQQLKTQIENANALGRTNLSDKGVEIPETATTYEIMSKIADVTSGGGMAPLDRTVTFTVDGEPYEIVSVQNGKSIELVLPNIENKLFCGWQLNGADVSFPYTPTTDVVLTAKMASTNSVPTGYTVQPYVKNNYDAFFSTGVIPTEDICCELDFQFSITSEDQKLLASYEEGKRYYPLWISSGFVASLGGVSPIKKYTSSADTNRHTVVFNDNHKCYFDNVDKDFISSLGVFPTEKTEPLFMFDCMNTSRSSVDNAKAKVYSCKIKENTTQKYIRVFVPCYRNSDGVVGMYDNVNNVFYSSESMRDFVSPDGIWQLIPNMTSNTSPLGVVSYNSKHSNKAAYNVFYQRYTNSNIGDMVSVSKNYLPLSGEAITNTFLQYDFGENNVPQTFNKVSLYGAFAGIPIGDTIVWKLQGSNNASDWTDLTNTTVTCDDDNRSTDSSTVKLAGTTVEFNSVGYRYIRIRPISFGGRSSIYVTGSHNFSVFQVSLFGNRIE